MIFLGSRTYTETDFTDGFGDALLTGLTIENDDLIVATATDDNGNTSEFSEVAIPPDRGLLQAYPE